MSAEAQHSACRVKIQLLMILIDTLDMENLLQMVHDGVPFRFVLLTLDEHSTRKLTFFKHDT